MSVSTKLDQIGRKMELLADKAKKIRPTSAIETERQGLSVNEFMNELKRAKRISNVNKS